MKTLANLKDNISNQFGAILNSLAIADITGLLTFILSGFSYDFPEVKAGLFKESDCTGGRVNVEDLDENFLEIKYIVPIQKVSSLSNIFYRDNGESLSYSSLDEVFTIQMTAQYINSMSSYYVPKKPMIINDSTSDYIVISKDSAIIYTTNRVVNPNNISEYIYGILQPYTYYKFIEFMVNSQYGKYMDVNDKIFNTIYGMLNSDMTNDDLDKINKVSLSGLEIVFDNKVDSYSSTLGSIAGNYNNPAFINQLNSYKEE